MFDAKRGRNVSGLVGNVSPFGKTLGRRGKVCRLLFFSGLQLPWISEWFEEIG